MAISIRPIAGTEMRLEAGRWPMPQTLRDSVPGVWARTRARSPTVWDGRILGFIQPNIGQDGILRAEAREDAYSAFLAWRDAGMPEFGLFHVFGLALILTSDGAVILGRMGPETLNAGRVYPPGGSLEPRDVRADGTVDMEASIATELWEETGLRTEDSRPGPLLATLDGPRISVSRVLRFDTTAAELAAQIRYNLAQQDQPELADIVVCRSVEEGRAAGGLTDYTLALLDYLASKDLFNRPER